MTRKFPPSVGGMQNVSYQLYQHLSHLSRTYLIAWGGSQAWLPFILPLFFIKAVFYSLRHRDIRVIFLADALLCPLGAVLKILTRKPVISLVHGLDMTWSLPPYQWLVPRCAQRLDSLISISENTKAECTQRGISEKKITVIPNGVELECFSRRVPKKDHLQNIAASLNKNLFNVKILLYVGRLMERKGVHSFIHNIFPRIRSRYEDVILLVVGDGPYRPVIEAAIQKENSGDYVFLLGQVSQALLNDAYLCADIFVMPNVPVPNDIEGFGIVALEAGMAGLPVVASRLEGIQDAIQEGKNGKLVDYQDYDSFANVIVDFLENDTKQTEFGELAREYNRTHYAWDHIAQQYLNLFHSLAP